MQGEVSRNGPGLQLDVELERRVEQVASANGMTPINVIREAVEEFAAHHNGSHAGEPNDESVYDVLSRAGLIGCIKGAPDSPTDLSTNPKHMEGFGRD